MKNQNIKSLFLKAFSLIQDEKHWTQFRIARNSSGEECLAENPNSVCWCSVGALCKVAFLYNFSSSEVDITLSIFRKYLIDEKQLSEYNDTHTHKEVIALWEKVGKGEGWL